MTGNDLQARSFDRYALQGRSLAVAHLHLLRRVPLSLLPLLLHQLQTVDVAFPVERKRIEDQLRTLDEMDAVAFSALMQPFAAIQPPVRLASVDWVNRPQQFTEQLTAWLWSQHQIDRYHQAAALFQQELQKRLPQVGADTPRWSFVLIGREVSQTNRPLFRKLRPFGTLFTNVDAEGGTEMLFREARSRAQQDPSPYSHWYIDGGDPLNAHPLTTISYARLVPAARREFDLLHRFTRSRTGGDTAMVEAVSSYVGALTPDELGIRGSQADAPLRHFAANLLTQGAGCQIFSTTFVQWAARECLHRAEPVTLLARYANRQTSAPMEQLLDRDPLVQPPDPQGSLIDADMGAYYTWINQSRLSGSANARFLAWWEGQGIALAIAPSLARGTSSGARATLGQLLDWMR